MYSLRISSAMMGVTAEAEDVLCEAGACILHLPDCYGPRVKCAQRGGHRRYDRTLKTTSCSRACSTTFSPKSSFGATSVTGA